VGWDFNDIWEIDEGLGYPTLRGLDKPGRPAAVYKEIYTATELNDVRNNLMGRYRLMSDIDLTGVNWEPLGTQTSPFCGIIDGNGHTISNLSIDLPNNDYVGMFGYVAGDISDLTISGSAVSGKDRIGGIAGCSKGKITDCTIAALELRGKTYIGGITGDNYGQVENCSVTEIDVVSNSAYIGGLIGVNRNNVTKCSVSSSISIKGGGNDTGGLIGYNSSGTVSQSYAKVDVIGTTYVGGLIGSISSGSMVERCYATGDVDGDSSIGGFAGSNGDTVRNCFSIGDVALKTKSYGFSSFSTGTYVPKNCYSVSKNVNGFGSNTSSTSYFDKDVISVSITNTQARTTQQMMQAATYVGWDFNDIWEIDEGFGYPTLRGLDKP